MYRFTLFGITDRKALANGCIIVRVTIHNGLYDGYDIFLSKLLIKEGQISKPRCRHTTDQRPKLWSSC